MRAFIDRIIYKLFRNELAPFGVKVILVVPGSFESGMQDTNRLLMMLQEAWDSCDEKVRKEYGNDFIERGSISLVIISQILLCTS